MSLSSRPLAQFKPNLLCWTPLGYADDIRVWRNFGSGPKTSFSTILRFLGGGLWPLGFLASFSQTAAPIRTKPSVLDSPQPPRQYMHVWWNFGFRLKTPFLTPQGLHFFSFGHSSLLQIFFALLSVSLPLSPSSFPSLSFLFFFFLPQTSSLSRCRQISQLHFPSCCSSHT